LLLGRHPIDIELEELITADKCKVAPESVDKAGAERQSEAAGK